MSDTQQQPGTGAQPAREMAEQIRAEVERDVADQLHAVRSQLEAARTQQQAGPEVVPFPPEPPVPPLPPHEAIVIQHPFNQGGMPPGAVDISIAFFLMLAVIIVGLPLARAWARRLDRTPAQPSIAPEISAQLQRIEHGMEAMSIEVERISESQRYLAKRLELAAIPAETAARPRS